MEAKSYRSVLFKSLALDLLKHFAALSLTGCLIGKLRVLINNSVIALNAWFPFQQLIDRYAILQFSKTQAISMKYIHIFKPGSLH